MSAGVEAVRELVAASPDAVIGLDEAQGLANTLDGPVCLLCLEMARQHFWLSQSEDKTPDQRMAHLEHAGEYISNVVNEAIV